MPYLGIEEMPDNISVLRFNIDGKRTDYDFSNLIYQSQSDTALVVNVIERLLQYTAERHQDTITAQELGAIFHLSDIGDVSTKGAVDGSMLTYQKASNCGDGCVGAHDTWKMFNAIDEQVGSAAYPFVFGPDGKAHTLSRPQNPSNYYQLGWNGANQLSYSSVPIVQSLPAHAVRLYVDTDTNQIIGLAN